MTNWLVDSAKERFGRLRIGRALYWWYRLGFGPTLSRLIRQSGKVQLGLHICGHVVRLEFDFADAWSSAMFRQIKRTGMYESATTLLVLTLLNRGGVFVDVGANVGYFTAIAGKIVGETGHVYAIEPLPSACSLMMRNVQLNGLANVTLIPELASDTHGWAALFTHPNDISLSNIFGPFLPGTQTLTVRKTRIEDELPSDVHPTLVKIDVEGSEAEVIRGMSRLISKSDNVTLLVEHNESIRERSSDKGSLFSSLSGFHIFETSSVGEGYVVLRGPLPLPQFVEQRTCMLLCIPKRHSNRALDSRN